VTPTPHGLVARPLTPERWPDLERLFGPSGAYSNCWCTFQRVTGAEYSRGCANGGAGNRALLKSLTDAGRQPGLMAFRDGEPMGWVSVGPRAEFGRLLRSPVTRLGDDERGDSSVWSVVCFWMPRANRRQGVGGFLLDAAVAHAREAGASRLEGYPIDTGGQRVASASAFVGTRELFERAGFQRVAEHRAGRPVMSLDLERLR
jgi:GNAT superfamily N-acetyltransferase